ncbi:DUF4260 family protein [Marinilactibacillus sp. GCM10026970]|uniref:DUF4260 family protein n=1 Tax=Marinilactibacillus sp. GCM10026970 TaxID=3252642 RepID=UPI0036133E3B
MTLEEKQNEIAFKIGKLFLLIAAIYTYFFVFHFSVPILLLFFFLIDLSMVGYIKDNKVGAIIYNSAHNLIIPCLLLTLGLYFQVNPLIYSSLILFIHIFLDRTFGFGLKYSDAFKHTHIN